MTEKNITLVERNNIELLDSWKSDFEFKPNVQITQWDILNIKCDAIVSPGNSFGFMDGGLDLAISKKFGWEIQQKLKGQIASLPNKELLVGQAITISTEQSPEYIICAPTMRVPSSHMIDSSVNAYLAMKAVLIEVIKYTNIKTVAITGLCTGTGKMNPKTASKQMLAAFEEIIENKTPDFPTFIDAQKQHFGLSPIK